jgi:hypothetical protein
MSGKKAAAKPTVGFEREVGDRRRSKWSKPLDAAAVRSLTSTR